MLVLYMNIWLVICNYVVNEYKWYPIPYAVPKLVVTNKKIKKIVMLDYRQCNVCVSNLCRWMFALVCLYKQL